MLNDTQTDLLNDFIDDYFIKAAESFFQYSGTETGEFKEEKSDRLEIIRKALTQPMMEFCELVLKLYPANIPYNSRKIALLVTLNSVVNARIQKFKYIQELLDSRLSTKPEELTPQEWANKERELVGKHVQTKMLAWLSTLEAKPAGEGQKKSPAPPLC
jgi:hypothetical protein